MNWSIHTTESSRRLQGDCVDPTPGKDRVEQGAAADAMFSMLYAELHRLAKGELWRSGPASLSVTTLLHEAYIDISAREGVSFPDRARFMGYAARVMRGIIIDHVRSRGAQKRGAGFDITSLDGDVLQNSVAAEELALISDGLRSGWLPCPDAQEDDHADQ